MVIIGSSNARVGLVRGMEILRAGGSALDAVEAAIRLVESNPDDHTVGLGGLPNLLGEVELDASIMDGHTLMAGAVGGVHGFEHPISIARRVMTDLPHSLLVGRGAERFARECGFEATDLLTAEARRLYEAGIRGDTSESQYAGPILQAMVGRLALDPERAAGKDTGTVNVLALDQAGHLAAGVSTSGFAWKYPGRVGDSAVIGAGNYCDDRYGAAACTGRGEMAIRAATAHSVVMHMRAGMTPEEAGRRAMEELDHLVDPYWSAMNAVVLTPDGRHAAFSTVPHTTYVFMTGTSTEVEQADRHLVPVMGSRNSGHGAR
jgi:beta-aspartyl-peptidase (threonine type)